MKNLTEEKLKAFFARVYNTGKAHGYELGRSAQSIDDHNRITGEQDVDTDELRDKLINELLQVTVSPHDELLAVLYAIERGEYSEGEESGMAAAAIAKYEAAIK